ncbi:MAG TPA: malto-oligosyltrehalose trehalohydrolase [Tepidisphaeraceae bacterium]|nr:malto-oligosyltrehalose trehalohydrolase [Tepidisphaeraceae bacterium]
MRARRLPVGAEVVLDGGADFRVSAPKRQQVEVVFEGDRAPALRLEREVDGYFRGFAPDAAADALYRLRLDNSNRLLPDPASRFQPDGPHGPSQVIDPTPFKWTDNNWPGIGPNGQVLYEMHIGTFTPQGTWDAAARQLPELAALGITCIEVMPVCEFPGKFGWGYDGVNLFAPSHLYGTPDDFRAFTDRAHALGVGVILDVVYNHLGPDGNYAREFTDDFFSSRYKTDWGEAINFDGDNSGPVRELFLANARYWIEEFHLDGFRFDATQNIYDSSADHILAAISRTARQAAGKRSIFLVNENEPQHTTIVRPPEQGGFGMDALWNDDFHHAAIVTLTGHNEAYLADYLGKPQEFISVAKFGYLFQGQRYKHQKQRRGTPTFGLPATAFINFIENHDQLANLARGLRTHQLASLAQYKAMVALLLLAPGTPMLFQGQEFAASAPFQYFADHTPDLAKLVKQGRAQFMGQFPSVATPQMQAQLPDPASPLTFEQCRLDLSERQKPGHAEIYAMYRDLLALRRDTPAFRGRWPGGLDGAVLSAEVFLLRFFNPDGDGRLLLVNFGNDLHLEVAPEPLLAPPLGMHWQVQWSSEDPRYLGLGITPMDTTENWRIPGHAAIVMRPMKSPPDHRDLAYYLEKQRME